MTAPLPPGLISIVSTNKLGPQPTDPADIIYERKQTLYKFWKAYEVQSRTIRDTTSIRCHQLFWRVWGDASLSLRLGQNTLLDLWLHCQQPIDIPPFREPIATRVNVPCLTGKSNQKSTTYERESQFEDGVRSSNSAQSLYGRSSNASPLRQVEGVSLDEQLSPRTVLSRPSLRRASSSSQAKKKVNINSKTKSRPPLTRDRSSQTGSSRDPNLTRPSALKNPRVSQEQKLARQNTIESQPSDNRDNFIPIRRTSTNISTLDLPSASSWLSDDSNSAITTSIVDEADSTAAPVPLVDKNFRTRFAQAQKRNSTTMVTSQNTPRVVHRTGSIVRFADEVDIQDITVSRQQQARSPFRRTASEGGPRDPIPRPSLRHEASTGSVAAVSEDGTEGVSDDEAVELPRTKSQLSMAIASLKHARGSTDRSEASTGPSLQARNEQEDLVAGRTGRKPSKEDQEILKMGRKDGVTKAGGINLPKSLTLQKSRVLQAPEFSEPERSYL